MKEHTLNTVRERNIFNDGYILGYKRGLRGEKPMNENQALTIIQEFESNMPIPTTAADWRINSEKIMGYLEAVNFLNK